MFKNRIGYSLLFLAILAGTILASIPPHERVKQMIRNGSIPKPYYLQHFQELKERGLNAPWREVLKKQGINIKSLGSGTTNRNSINAVNSSFKILMIVVDFSDKAHAVSPAVFDNIGFGSTQGTLKHYYNSLSSGTFDIVTVNLPSSMGWMRMPQTYSYYVNGQQGEGSYPNNAQKLAEDACDAVDGIVNFDNYDNDGDGLVDGLVIVHSGKGAEFTGSNYDIWSHSWGMNGAKKHDNVYTYAYTMQPEYWDNPGDITCGVFAHECGHMIFDLPDLYDTDYGSEGLGNWSLMAGGSWNGPSGKGGSPAYPDAWSRSQMHWGTAQFATVQNIYSNTVNQQILNAENSATVYKVWKYGAAGSEYFMLENRQQTGYDSYLPGNGLLIYHIDERYRGNDNEWYPGHTAYGHYNVALEQADGLYSLEKNPDNRGDSGDPFPGSANNRSFSSSTAPNSNDYNGNTTYVEVANISGSASTMTADIYMGNVIVAQTLADNLTQVGTVGRWNGSSFSTRLTPGQPISVVPGNDEILQGDQGLYSNQKYINWVKNDNEKLGLLNHHVFNVQARDRKYNALFNPTNTNVTIQNLFEGSTSINPPDNTIDFMDPWFINYKDPNYYNTLRNQGMSAGFLSRPSPFNPNTTTLYENSQPYNGVFFNQTVSSGTFYSVRAPLKLTKNLGGTLGTREFYFQNWTTSNATVQQNGVNPSGFDQKAVIFIGDIASVTANYKGTLLSNNTSSFSNSSQRKFIRTPDGSLHMVYESMGYVWYERSSDGGNTWIIMNGGKPLSTNPSKSPSIDYCGNSNEGTIGIVFQEKSLNLWECEGKIKYYPVFYSNGVYGNSILQNIELLYDEVYDTFDTSPVIAFGSTSPYFLVVWKGIEGLMTKYFNGNNSTAIAPLSSSAVLYSVSDQTSEHPFLVSNRLGNTIFHLAWDENTSPTTGTIRYCKLSAGSTVDVVQGSYNSDLSSGSGFTKNSMPSLIPCPDNTVRMSWLGATTYGRKSSAFRGMFGDGSWNPRFWSFGSNIASQCINLGSDGYYILFSDYTSGSYKNQFTDSRTLSNIYTLNTTGKDVQLNNDAGGSSRTMYAMAFSSQGSLPYTFTKSNTIGSYYGLYKENSRETSGRMVVLKTDSLSEFYFSLQDISLDGRPVKFMEVSDTLRITDVNSLNKYMITDPFALTDNSKFLFNLNYGLTDSARGIKALGKEGSISYTVELIDENGSVLQNFNKVSFSKDYFLKNKQTSFQVNMKGIGNKTVRMRLRTEVNFNAECFLVDSHCVPDENISLYKASEIEKIDYNGKEVVKEYAISRNYPNPFNPSTVIDYQVPKTSKVTLKIFDMLGKEVATLVNEIKEMGRYSVKFDASELTSGTYIYEIRANNFVKSGKMMLLK